MADKIRTFICIEIPQEIISLLGIMQDRLRSESRGARWTRPEGIHLTLKFLGDIAPDRIEPITQAVTRAVANIPEFTLILDQPGVFPNSRKPKVLWVGLKDPSEQLIACHSDIEKALVPLGFPPEERRFSPHLTLARLKFPNDATTLISQLGREKIDPIEFTAHEVVIKKSDLRPDGAVYTSLRNIGLSLS